MTSTPRFAAVIGQEGVVQLLRRLVARDRLPHALLLEGTPGCGRRTLARALTAALLCQRPIAGDACTVCPSCVQFAQGTHPDVVALPHDTEETDPDPDQAKAIRERLTAEAVREVIEQRAWESALLGGRRVFLLYSVERLQGNQAKAANALLKILEEPPRDTVLILTTEHAGGLLRTIRSRVQLYRLQPLSPDAVERILVGRGLAPADARRRAALSGGSHRGLLGEEPAAAPVEDLATLLETGYSAALISSLVARLPQRSNDGSPSPAEQRRICRQWLLELQRHLRPQLATATALRAAECLDRVSLALRDLQRNLPPRLALEGLVLSRA